MPSTCKYTVPIAAVSAVAVGALLYCHMSKCCAQKKNAASFAATKDLVQKSWAQVKAAFALQDVGELFYNTLFEANPALAKTVFRATDKKEQARKLMEMVDAAIGLLDNTDKLLPILKDLGERHGAYGVEDEHYPAVGQCLLATLKKGLGAAFTDDVKAAWTTVYGIIQDNMLAGAHTEKGLKLLAEYRQREADRFTQTKTHVRDSWAQVKGAFALQDVGELFYNTLFEANPALAKTVFRATDKKEQARKLMEMVDAAIGLLDNTDKLLPILKDLGERHGAYGVEDEHYPAVGESLIATLAKGLGAAFTDDVKAAWIAVYGIIQDNMMAGAHTEKGLRLLAEYRKNQQ